MKFPCLLAFSCGRMDVDACFVPLPEPFEFTPDTYISRDSSEMEENGQWKIKYNDLVFAGGKWHRERNVLILNGPKLNGDFYMTIGEKRLRSMLLLMDIRGADYYRSSESAGVPPEEL